MDEPSDHDLMARTAIGDARAFRILADRHAGRALWLAGRMLPNESVAEDIVQEAFLRVWRSAPRWRPQAKFRTWLYRIVVNLCLNARRRAPHLPLDAAGEARDPAPTPDEHLEAGERDRRLADAIAALPERQRAAILLTYQEGLGNAEVADVLGTSISAVEALLGRARQTLRGAFDDIRGENS